MPANRDNNSGKEPADQGPSQTFLIGSLKAHEVFSNTCPSARTIVGYSITLERWCVIQIRCKRWGCRHCGERRMNRFAWRVEHAKPNRLLTLTVANRCWSTPRAAYEGTTRKVTELAVSIRRKFGEFEYFRVLEATKIGWPHYHLVVRSEYIPQAWIKKRWESLTGATIVDVRKIRETKNVYFYVIKYLGKQKVIPWTARRVSWSRRFFNDPKFESGQSLNLTQVGWLDEEPAEVIRRHFHPFRIASYSKDCWTIETGKGFSVGEEREQIGKVRRKRRRKG